MASCTLAIILLGSAARAPAARAQAADTARRPMTMADIIGMTTFGSQPHGYVPEDIDVPSLDGRLHVAVVKRGDVARNTNVFSLLLFRTDQLFAKPKPDTLLTLVSSSNRPAIHSVRWLSDNHTLVFLGEHPGELPQIYALDTRTRTLTPRTHQATEIVSFDIAPSGDPVVYAAKPAVDTSDYPAMRQRGFAVRPTQFVGDVLVGAWADAASDWFSSTNPQLLVVHDSAPAPSAISLPGPIYRTCYPTTLSMAPTGRLALILCTRAKAPERWKAYTEPLIARLLAGGAALPEFALLDLERGTIDPLVDAPVQGASSRWSPTGTSVVIANAFLPLDTADSAERRARAAKAGIAEVDVRTRQVTTIVHRDSLDVVGWDSAGTTVDFLPGIYSTGSAEAPHTRYRKTARGWVEVKRGGKAKTAAELIVEQGLNQPAHLVAVDRARARRATVLDPNPQLAELRLGKEEIVHWRTRSGQARSGGLYYPPDFRKGDRYPLVIQTHGFDSTAFQPDGTFPTGNAAQPMAAAGMLVLQLGAGDYASAVSDIVTSNEGPHAMEEIEGVIDHLDSLGLIARSRVGVIGFSRTCFHVLYTLTHSRYPIAAAAITDGVDFSYLQYVLFQNAQLGAGNTLDEFGGVNGGPPWGKTQDLWRERAPGFNLDRVTAPLRLEAIGLASALSEWEPYAGLLLQHKPAELFVLPGGEHVLIKPWERRASAEGNADWFRFWLKGEKDPDLAKAGQYARWRELRRLQAPRTAGDSTALEHKSE